MKPQQIIDIEVHLGIKINELLKDDILDSENEKTYQLSDNNVVIGLNLCNCLITDLSFLQKLKDLTSLNLARNNIIDVYFLKELNHLTKLDLSSNKISDLNALKDLKNLKILILALNKISDISPLQNLSNLNHINLFVNKIVDISPLYKNKKISNIYIGFNQVSNISGIKNLNKIVNLDLRENNISNIEDLKHLTNIEYLDLGGNAINNLAPLSTLDKLKTLDIASNKFTTITPLSKILSLEYLELRNNKIVDFSVLIKLFRLNYLDVERCEITNLKDFKELKSLKTLILKKNNITDISWIKDLENLIKLDLRENKITDISPLKKLIVLKKVDLEDNDIFDITDLLKIESLKSVNLKGNKKVEIDYPTEVLQAGWEAIKQFSEKSKEIVPFKHVKVLLLGNPNIGKSNLLEFLETNAIPTKNDSTHGVIYKSIVINNINFHVWDFGGQEYFHATHKLFFSPNAINIVLWGKDIPRQGEVENIFFDLNYWLRTVEQLNSDSKKEEVLIIENKIDLNSPENQETNLNQKEFADKYKTLNCTFTNFSLLTLKRTEVFKSIFIEKAENIISKFNFPAFYEVFWKRIQEKNKDIVTVEEINNRPHKENVIAALKVFHNMGMLLYFHDLTPEKVFCKPQVLLDLLYEKVLSKDKKDRLTKQEIEKSIINNSLELNIEEVIKLLKHFDLVFEIKAEKDIFFIPQYLKSINPYVSDLKELIFKGSNIKIYGDNYLMSIAMLKIFSKYGNYVTKEKDSYRFWRNGLIIRKDDSILMIEFNRNKQLIKLYLDKESENLELQKEVVDFILDLPEDLDLPKRNFDNHKEKRWRDVQNPEDEDHSPNFSERIQNYDGYLEHFENRNWENYYLWSSEYFTVSVSIDCEYFIEWKTLKNNENLSEINFCNENGVLKKILSNEYCHLINKERQNEVRSKTESNTKIMGDQNNFYGPTNIVDSQLGGIGNNYHNYKNMYKNNSEITELKTILEELKHSKAFNEQWLNEFIETLKTLNELENAENKETEEKSVSRIKQFFNKGKEFKDWVGIALLPGEIISKVEKMFEIIQNFSK